MYFTGLEYLKIDIANSFGLDKENWDVRLKWTNDNITNLEALVQMAEEPAQFLAGVMALRKAEQNIPTGYMVGLDATASGIQLLAILSGCPVSADSVNLTKNPDRQDVYTRCYVRMNQILNTHGTIPRRDVKQALMTAMYGSKKVPKDIFGEDTPELAAFYQVVDELLPGVNLLNKALIGLWQDDAFTHEWTLPDGFDVKIKVIVEVEYEVMFNEKPHLIRLKQNLPKKGGIALGANIIHSIDGMIVREMNRRCNFNPDHIERLFKMTVGGTSTTRPKDAQLIRLLLLSEASGFFSAAMLDCIDAQNFGLLDPDHVRALKMLMLSMQTSFPLVAIHDCFKFHPNYGNDVRDHYKNILAELASSNVLVHIAEQITGRVMGSIAEDISDLVADSDYALS